MQIEVKPASLGWTCEVTFEDRSGVSRHTVSVSSGDLARWGRGEGESAVEDLVRRSFEFLLRREPAGSILSRFELSVIQRYFPEYDEEIRR
jgi:hypothetical protein